MSTHRRYFIWLAVGVLCAACSLYNRPEERDLCEQHAMQCDPLATCTSEDTEYHCTCPDNYEDVSGDGTECRDIDECSGSRPPCDAIATCENEPGGFVCKCPEGYLPSNDGRKCDEIDECRSGAHECDLATQNCVNLPGPDHLCECKDGFAEKNGTCKDIDECAAPSNPCEAPRQCANRSGSYDCPCIAPAQVIGESCVLVDPCADPDKCGEGTRCVTVGDDDFRCECLEGYTRLRDSQRCVDIDECEGDPCPAGAICNNLDGSFECACRGYYTMSADGQECRDERLTWSTALPSTDDVFPLIDRAGNLILAGTFKGELELCGEQRTARGGSDAFVVKYDRERRCQWIQTFGNVGADRLYAATLDPEGNPVVIGDFLETVAIGDFTFAIPAHAGQAVAKLSAATGDGLWARPFNNLQRPVLNFLERTGLTTDRDGNVFWAWCVPKNVEALDEPWRARPRVIWYPLLVKLDARSGEIVWWKRFPSDNGMFTAVAVDSKGDLVLAGEYIGLVEVDDTILEGTPTRWNGFVAKLSPDGSAQWAQRIDMDSTNGLPIALIPDSDDIVTGATFRGALRFGGESLMSQDALQDIMIARLAAATGNVVWMRTFGGAEADELGELTVDGSGRIGFHGAFSGVMDLGEGPLVAGPEWRDLFVASLDSSGQLRWAQRFGGAGPERPGRLVLSRRDELIATGSFTPPLEIGDTLLPESADESVIVLQLEP